jgi:NodT family efflux transporter outer membrane factor (OMF) lipoprotein
MRINGSESIARVTVLTMVALTAACTMGPDYKQPEVDVPDVWKAKAAEEVEVEEGGSSSIQTWWENLDDPTLTDLLRRAQEANLDLEIAVARIREARAVHRIEKGAWYPQVDGQADAGAQQFSEQAFGEFGGDTIESYTLGVGASWELDVFGRIRRSVESARAAFEGSVEDYRDVLVVLLAEVARNYVDVMALQERIELKEGNVRAQQDSLQLTQDRFNAGLTSALDVAQAESNLANTEAQIPPLRFQLTVALNRIAVLLGENPGSVHDELLGRWDIPTVPDEIVTLIPADVVRQRPDIRGAERALASQTARIGVATANLYPRFSLTGFLGLDARNLGDLASGDALTWNVGLPIVAPLFQGGRLRGQIQVEEARTDQLLSDYELTVLEALEEVENALVAYAQERLRRERLARAVRASERSVELVRTQYLAGLTNFQNVLDSQRSLTDQQDQLAESEGLVIKSLIALYRALGGGWQPDPENEETYTASFQ